MRPIILILALLCTAPSGAEIRVVDDAVVPEASPCSSDAACRRYWSLVCGAGVIDARAGTDVYGTRFCTALCVRGVALWRAKYAVVTEVCD